MNDEIKKYRYRSLEELFRVCEWSYDFDRMAHAGETVFNQRSQRRRIGFKLSYGAHHIGTYGFETGNFYVDFRIIELSAEDMFGVTFERIAEATENIFGIPAQVTVPFSSVWSLQMKLD